MKILLLLMIILSSCKALDYKLDPEVYYENDVCFSYFTGGTKNTFCGVGVLPYQGQYSLEINSYTNLDLFTATTCHREISTKDPDRGIFKRNGRVWVEYTPMIERERMCPLYIGAFSRTDRQALGIIVLENPAYRLDATVYCNGKQFNARGIFACQSKEGLIQRIEFQEPVKITAPTNGPSSRLSPCPDLEKFLSTDGKVFEYINPNRECLYGFVGKTSRNIFKLYTIGWEKLIVK